MTRATSVFLDVLRLAAAFTVFLAHTAHYWRPASVGAMQVVAHDAVVVFFVLSGYVIMFTVEEKTRDARSYVISRLSRLYSVVVPALGVTVVLWWLGRELDPMLYAQYARNQMGIRYFATAFFLNETWFLNAYPPGNTPFWSLGYEAWFYVLLGLSVYVRPWKLRLAAVVAGGLLAGPKVLLLLPVWLAGVAAYRWRDRFTLSRPAAITGFVLALVATGVAMVGLPDWPGAVGDAPWYFSGAAGTDLVVGVTLAATFWFFRRAFCDCAVPAGVCRVVRWSANHTFSLYLYHAPLVIFATAVVPPLGASWMLGAGVMSVILLVVIILGFVGESQRGRWERLFAAILSRTAGRSR